MSIFFGLKNAIMSHYWQPLTNVIYVAVGKNQSLEKVSRSFFTLKFMNIVFVRDYQEHIEAYTYNLFGAGSGHLQKLDLIGNIATICFPDRLEDLRGYHYQVFIVQLVPRLEYDFRLMRTIAKHQNLQKRRYSIFGC